MRFYSISKILNYPTIYEAEKHTCNWEDAITQKKKCFRLAAHELWTFHRRKTLHKIRNLQRSVVAVFCHLSFLRIPIIIRKQQLNQEKHYKRKFQWHTFVALSGWTQIWRCSPSIILNEKWIKEWLFFWSAIWLPNAQPWATARGQPH